MKIINRFTGAVIFEGEFETVKRAVEAANLSGANLSEANLSGANLSGANLRLADLYGANLSGANLSGADLSGANLSGANLSGANLFGANLSDANLSGADLRRANLSGANLSGANLSGAVAPFEGDIRATINERVNQEGCALEMGSWHTCDTTHCIAGWAVVIHPQGLELEEKHGTNAAAALIFSASGINPIPDFYASNEDAMAWLKDGKV